MPSTMPPACPITRPGPARSGCPIAFGLDLFGDRWTLLILRDLLFQGRCAFRELASEEHIATNILSDRLKRLEASGLVRRLPHESDGRQAVYRPTEAARALVPALVELAYWGALHDSETDAPPTFRAAYEADRDALVARIQAASAPE